VHAVEVADADKRRAEVAGNIVEFVESSHLESSSPPRRRARGVFS
jgi:hypothetical protein